MPITDALAPFCDGQGVALGIKTGVVNLSGASTVIPAQVLILTPNAINYVYFDLTALDVEQNTSGFSGNVIPIAIATTQFDYISELQDVRPDFIGGAGTGGISSDGPISIQSTGDAVSIESATNLTLTADDGNISIIASSNATDITIFAEGGVLSLAGANGVSVGSSALGAVGFYGSAGTAQPTVSGSKGANAALASLITALAGLGLIHDTTT